MTPYTWLSSSLRISIDDLARSKDLWECILSVSKGHAWEGNEGIFIYEVQCAFKRKTNTSIREYFKSLEVATF